MKPDTKKIIGSMTLLGALLGLLFISPFAMIVSDLVHQNHFELKGLSLSALIMTSLKEAFGPNFLIWKIAHGAAGGMIGFAFGLIFLRLFKEEQARQALQEGFRREEMSIEIGKLTRGIVHNINNHLTVLQGNASLLKMNYPSDRNVDEMIEASRQLDEMARTILEHAKIQKGTQKELDLNEILKKNLEFLKGNSFFKREVRVILDFDPTLPQIRGCESDFLQSTYNLIDNATDAMTKSPRKELRLVTHHDEKNVYLDIMDSGEGIPKEILPKLFTAGLTTKPFEAKNGEPTGTGFGLSNVKDLMKPYQAEIDVASKPGETRFTLMIPIHAKKPADTLPNISFAQAA